MACRSSRDELTGVTCGQAVPGAVRLLCAFARSRQRASHLGVKEPSPKPIHGILDWPRIREVGVVKPLIRFARVLARAFLSSETPKKKLGARAEQRGRTCNVKEHVGLLACSSG